VAGTGATFEPRGITSESTENRAQDKDGGGYKGVGAAENDKKPTSRLTSRTRKGEEEESAVASGKGPGLHGRRDVGVRSLEPPKRVLESSASRGGGVLLAATRIRKEAGSSCDTHSGTTS